MFKYYKFTNTFKWFFTPQLHRHRLFIKEYIRFYAKYQQPISKLTKRSLGYTGFIRGISSNNKALEKEIIDKIEIENKNKIINNYNRWTRIKNKVKLVLMRQSRPWTLDDFMALFSWVFLSNTVFILLGTTTFFSLILFIANSFQFQEWVKNRLSKLITKQLGMEVKIGNAVVPNWKSGRITLNNVLLQYNVVKNNEELSHPDSPAIWDLSFDSIDITLSLIRWLDGKGIIKDCVIKGMRGVIDRSLVTYPEDQMFDPEKARQLNQKDDMELNSLLLEDCLITICHPYGFRPFQVSIFNANIPLLRRRWLLYDMICANSIVGMFDNCLFSVHMKQNDNNSNNNEWNMFKRSHFRVDGVPIDQFNGGVEGPFGWIRSGRVDFDVDFMIPQVNEQDLIQMVTKDLMIKFDEVVSKNLENLSIELPHNFPPPLIQLLYQVKNTPLDSLRVQKRLDSIKELDKLIFDFNIAFHNIKAEIPINADELSLASQAVIRPVVAFMNSNRTLIPIQCRVITDLNKFDGAWTVYDSELAYDLSKQVSIELINLVKDESERNRRLKRVGLWGLQSLAKNLITLIEYARGTRGFWHYLGHVHEI